VVARCLVRLTVPRRGGWRSWRAVSGTFEHRLAEQGSDVVLTPRIDRELRGRGRDYIRVLVVAAVVADDVAEALGLAWWAFKEAASGLFEGPGQCSVLARVRLGGIGAKREFSLMARR
jgi:hypothetical protein